MFLTSRNFWGRSGYLRDIIEDEIDENAHAFPINIEASYTLAEADRSSA